MAALMVVAWYHVGSKVVEDNHYAVGYCVLGVMGDALNPDGHRWVNSK